MALKLIEISPVSPLSGPDSSRDSVGSLSLPLTFFDLMWIRLRPVQRVFFYRFTELTRGEFDSVIAPKLRHSLSVVLQHFLPIAGQIKWDPQELKPSIVTSANDAVQLTVAETDADFTCLSGDGQQPAIGLRNLVSELVVSDDSASILSLQITLFPNQGFCIGVTAHHAVLDGKATMMFIKAWAHICNKEQELKDKLLPSLPEELTPCFDREVVKYPASLDARMLDLFSSFTMDKTQTRNLKLVPTREISDAVVRVTVELTREDIEKLRERAKNELLHQEQYHLSTFVITYSYIWTCMVKARGGDVKIPCCIGFVADFRDRLEPPAPATYFGSCVFPVGCFDTKVGTFVDERGFVTAVKIISDLVKSLGSRGTEELFEELKEGLKQIKPGTKLGSVAGSTRLGVYGSDFGWGKPVKVDVVSIDQNEAFSMAEKRDGSGGVEIGVCLDNNDMINFISLFNNGLI